MRVVKRRKSSRFRGSQTARRGRKSRTRGSGNQGGKGMAGTGKRGDQKKSLVINLTGGNNYFGKDKTLRRGRITPKLKVINLSQINENLLSFKMKDNYLDLTGYKILGDGEIKLKLKIKSSAASSSAFEKVKASGGEIILVNFKETPAPKSSEKPVKAKKAKA